MLGQPRYPLIDAGRKQVDSLPKTGAICRQWVRCGRPACRCSRGPLHGPYHYLFWREDGRLRKRYVRMADASAVRAACEARRQEERRTRQEARAWLEEWRQLKRLLWEVLRDG